MNRGVEELNTELADKLKNLPVEPGVYLMKSDHGKIIYVGKAKNIKNRVSSYFRDSSSHNLKTTSLVREISNIDFILTASEVEALLLERTLITQHRPMYNILLQDDKQYPLLRIDLREKWPRIEKVRRRKDDGATYLGPFSSATRLRTVLKAMYRVFPLIRCSKTEFENARRPCSYYHMKMCLGPCTLPVTESAYKEMMSDALEFLQGKDKTLIQNLKEKMYKASSSQNYELAGQLRDQLQAIESIHTKQHVVSKKISDADIVVYSRTENHEEFFYTMYIRNYNVIGADQFSFKHVLSSGADSIEAFLLQFYQQNDCPKEIITNMEIENPNALMETIAKGSSQKPTLYTDSERGERAALVKLALKNMEFAINEKNKQLSSANSSLVVLAKILGLPEDSENTLHRIECMDISNFQGASTVASNICFINGKPQKEFYRIYKIQSTQDKPDDFASIHEVVTRRLKRGVFENDLPDLLVIDGGKGQLSAAMAAKAQYPGLNLKIISLAKSRLEKVSNNPLKNTISEMSYSDERIYIDPESEPIGLVVGSPAFRLLTHLRDEAHRFAISHYRRSHRKKNLTSELDSIRGVGPVLRKRLLEFYGGVEKLKNAPLDELKKIQGMTEKTAVAILASLKTD